MYDIVYHYTSPNGILGILQRKALWFTDCQYLNDMGEFVYIREPFKNAYEKLNKECGKSMENLDAFIDSFFISPYENLAFNSSKKQGKFFRGFNSLRYYVLCASINPDTANMWNYYIKNGAYKGYNLGIDRSFISKWFSNNKNNEIGFLEGKVIYDKQKQIDMIYNKLEELTNIFEERKKSINKDDENYDYFLDQLSDDYQSELYDYIHEKKLFFKNPAFSCEEEYRFILKVNNDFFENDKLSLKFRAGASGIITPYIEWKFTLDEKEQLFKQISLAPMMEATLAEESFKRFLAVEVRRNIEIKKSSIKLRF